MNTASVSLNRSFRRLNRRLAAGSRWHPLICFTVSLLVSAIFAAAYIPLPMVHDEFSYLLAADTFAMGRMANPVHPMWQFFESFHIIQQPSYASKYPPGQGAILSIGIVVFGHPIFGTVISTALAAGTTCWMLQGWTTRFWALVGGLLSATHGSIQLAWAFTYWGGSVAMIGGALMLGALPRIAENPRIFSGLALGSGAVVLLFTRPFEGLVVGICVLFTLLLIIFRFHRKRSSNLLLSRSLLPATLLLIIGLALLAVYNYKVTGDPFTMPYQEHARQYGQSPPFLFQPIKQPTTDYNHGKLKLFYSQWEPRYYHAQQSISGLLQEKYRRFKQMSEFYFSYGMVVSLLFLPWMFRRKLRFFWITFLIFMAGQMSLTWVHAHYLAPAAPLLFLFVVESFRLVPVLCRRFPVLIIILPFAIALHLIFLGDKFEKYLRQESGHWLLGQIQIAHELGKSPVKDVVLVQYKKGHWVHAEWVYNGADIDGSEIVWARFINDHENQRLAEYFPDRNVWVARVGRKNDTELIPYRMVE